LYGTVSRGFMPQRAKAIKDILGQTLSRLGLNQRLREIDAVRLFADAAGEKIAAKAEAVKIENGKLYVRVASSTWRQELTYSSRELIATLNKILGEDIVKEIKFIA